MCDERPRIALTLGDVAGIGPEVVARACRHEALFSVCRPVVVGHPQVLQRAFELIGAPGRVQAVASLADAPTRDFEIACWNPAGDDAAKVPAAVNDPRSGRAAYECVVTAARAALAGDVDAIVTAPLSKKALSLAGIHHPGHTEILAELCGVRHYAMMLYLSELTPTAWATPSPESFRPVLLRPGHSLAVAHVTLHTSVASVPEMLSAALIGEKIGLLDQFLRDVRGGQPGRIGVCALNPHAGEEGLFGDEEARLIAPAVTLARAAGQNALGPLPADTLLLRACQGEFDGVVAMYHDQGHIALKLAGFGRAVNVTLGLPIVRTSPSHGTAYDIAWQGRADASGMIAAIEVAAKLGARQ
jgi:4-phospho-D-threonate 3-dehydrogenase / 4-phospho-D-erythronate 3-dehydrogenase